MHVDMVVEDRMRAFGRAVHAHAQCNPGPHEKLAVMTLITSAWVPGGIALGNSLQAVRREQRVAFDMLSICVDEKLPFVSADARLRDAGWTCVGHEDIPGISSRWRWDSLMKLAPFALDQYSRIVLVDADMIVVSAWLFTTLFCLPLPAGTIGATRDCPAAFIGHPPGVAAREIQAGLIVLRPARTLYNDMLAAHRNRSALGYFNEGSAQGFLTEYWRGRVVWLPSNFNLVQSSYCVTLLWAANAA